SETSTPAPPERASAQERQRIWAPTGACTLVTVVQPVAPPGAWRQAFATARCQAPACLTGSRPTTRGARHLSAGLADTPETRSSAWCRRRHQALFVRSLEVGDRGPVAGGLPARAARVPRHL